MLVRWQPFQEIEEMRRQFDRLFQDFATIGRENLTGEWSPASELRDDGEHLTLRLIVPEIDPKDLDIEVTKDSIAISGERRHERKEESEKGYYWSEMSYGKFRRAFALPVAVESEKVKAEYNNGVLTLTLPKSPELKTFKVNIASELPAASS